MSCKEIDYKSPTHELPALVAKPGIYWRTSTNWQVITLSLHFRAGRLELHFVQLKIDTALFD